MYIAIDDIAITHLVFDEEFTNAIERKQVAQQDVERVKVRLPVLWLFPTSSRLRFPQFDVQKAEQEKLAAIIRSEGESEAAKILTSALTVGPALLELRRLEAAKEIAQLLSKSPNVVFVPNHGNMILNVPKPWWHLQDSLHWWLCLLLWTGNSCRSETQKICTHITASLRMRRNVNGGSWFDPRQYSPHQCKNRNSSSKANIFQEAHNESPPLQSPMALSWVPTKEQRADWMSSDVSSSTSKEDSTWPEQSAK
jgi:hypothetical protein